MIASLSSSSKPTISERERSELGLADWVLKCLLGFGWKQGSEDEYK
ncbi:hypothetical protein RchiOBHm_Chr1g0357631 [Rosa chinensis]|uniref:Uncharacterized protein n=1 Tax=Rosa chinensis TaxID=74649 RepID=A0A2P6SHW4_ROSCH|nr:hypothetical protein RchiOBHm_Chr5g0082601 [Rosa chinensis]PRQ58285.1 hypothetical protein RchiOBHm_Chr1g0357631 [Rosa chinensis]